MKILGCLFLTFIGIGVTSADEFTDKMAAEKAAQIKMEEEQARENNSLTVPDATLAKMDYRNWRIGSLRGEKRLVNNSPKGCLGWDDACKSFGGEASKVIEGKLKKIYFPITGWEVDPIIIISKKDGSTISVKAALSGGANAASNDDRRYVELVIEKLGGKPKNGNPFKY